MPLQRCLILILVIALLPLLSMAQATSKPVPIVIVTKADGTTARGKLISAEWDKVILSADGQDVTLKWHEISRLSNGLTRAKVIEEFKSANKGKLCESCQGNHDTRCDSCKGTSHLAAAVADCTTCKGELLVKCKSPGCKDGQIPCPAPCLKLSQGRWIERDGKRIREFKSPGGTWFFSDAHLGELIVQEQGKWVSKGACPTCSGKQTLPDPACEATSKIPCPTHSKATSEPCPKCDHGRIVCTTCTGSGLKP